MRRLLLCVLALMLIIPSACADGENTLLRHAVELGRELDALAEDGERARTYTSEPEVLEIIRAYGEGSHDAPCEVREAVLDEILDMMPEVLDEIPAAGKRQVQNMIPRMILQGCINSFGVQTVVANTILRADVTFAMPNAEGRGLWVMEYENAASVAVAWYAENGAVHMEASFLPSDVEITANTRVIAAARPALDAYAASLAAELQVLAGDVQYMMLMGLSDEVLAVAGDYAADEPTPHLTLCTLTDDAQAVNAVLMQQIAYIGDVALAAVGSLHTTLIFADEEASGTGLYLFLYEDGAPIIITWKGENGAYHLSATFQPGEYPASCRNADDVNVWAQSLGMTLNFQPLGVMLLP